MKHILLCIILFFASSLSLAEQSDVPYKKATQQYFMFSIERLKNAEEILERLSQKLEAGHYESIKEDYIKAHYQYDSVRPLILLFPDLNNLVDTHVEDLPKDPENPKFVGFHAVEYELFVKNDPARAFVETQKLINNLRIMIRYIQTQEITFSHMMNLLPVFVQQILNNKLTGYDSTYSGSSLGEIASSMEGVHLIINQTREFLPTTLVAELEKSENNIYTILDHYKVDDIHQPYSELKSTDKALLHRETQRLSELLIQLNIIIAKQLTTSAVQHHNT